MFNHICIPFLISNTLCTVYIMGRASCWSCPGNRQHNSVYLKNCMYVWYPKNMWLMNVDDHQFLNTDLIFQVSTIFGQTWIIDMFLQFCHWCSVVPFSWRPSKQPIIGFLQGNICGWFTSLNYLTLPAGLSENGLYHQKVWTTEFRFLPNFQRYQGNPKLNGGLMGTTWRFPKMGGYPQLSSLLIGFSMKSTIQLLGCPHDYGNLHMGKPSKKPRGKSQRFAQGLADCHNGTVDQDGRHLAIFLWGLSMFIVVYPWFIHILSMVYLMKWYTLPLLNDMKHTTITKHLWFRGFPPWPIYFSMSGIFEASGGLTLHPTSISSMWASNHD